MTKFNRINLQPREFVHIVVISLVFAFIVSFREWGFASFDAAIGLTNLLRSFIIILFSLSLMLLAQKYAAKIFNVKATFKPWWFGILIGIFLAYFSFGFWWILLPGGIACSETGKLLIGKKKQAIKIKTIAKIAVTGPLLCLMLAIIFRFLYLNSGWQFFHKAMLINLALVIGNMLPFPQFERLFFIRLSNRFELFYVEKGCEANLPGFYIIIHRTWKYIFTLVFFVTASIMIVISENLFAMLLLPFAIALLISFSYFWHKL